MNSREQAQRLVRLGLLAVAALALAATWRTTAEIQQRAAREEVLGLSLVRAQGAKKPASALETLKPLVASSQPARGPVSADATLAAVFTPPPAEPEQVTPPVPPAPPCKELVVPVLQVQALGDQAAILNGRWTRVGEELPVALAEHFGVRRVAVLEAVTMTSIRVRCGRERFDVIAARRAH